MIDSAPMASALASSPCDRSGRMLGKSDLLQPVVGEKGARSPPRWPQTTRNRLLGDSHHPRRQLVLLDTPGIHKPHHYWAAALVKSARGCHLVEVDWCCLLVDGSERPVRCDAFIVQLLSRPARCRGRATSRISFDPARRPFPCQKQLGRSASEEA